MSWILSSIHVPPNDSSSLLNVAVSELGRKSGNALNDGDQVDSDFSQLCDYMYAMLIKVANPWQSLII